jgi:hypothetical protein
MAIVFVLTTPVAMVYSSPEARPIAANIAETATKAPSVVSASKTSRRRGSGWVVG